MVEAIFSSSELTFLFNAILSIFIGFLIGIERESRGKDAGISTQSLVILGSMLFTFLSLNVLSDSTTRIAASVVSGIGFIGAGVILKDGLDVRNLTTAASIWVSAAIGMAIGFQYYIVAIITTLAAFVILRIPHMVPQGCRADDS